MTNHEAYTKLLQNMYAIYDNREAVNIADWVFENVTGKKKVDRIIYKNLQLDSEQEIKLANCTNELIQHRPVQYVLNEAWFAGLKLYVDESVLIPRPETEELVDWIVEENSKFKIQNSKFSIIEIGTGSGCIAIALKKKIAGAEVSALDVSEDALAVAKKNTSTQNVDIKFHQLDFLDESQWNNVGVFDVIVSNPPYIKQSEGADMQKNVLMHEPHLALFVPDEDALIFYRKIAVFAQVHLNENGSVYVEINEALGAEIEKLFKDFEFASVELKKDLQGKDRMVKASKHR
jgi:release factor glutamine methyltransferase